MKWTLADLLRKYLLIYIHEEVQDGRAKNTALYCGKCIPSKQRIESTTS